MIVCDNKDLNELLKTNASFKQNFEKLMSAFQDRIWTKETCNFFKALCEDLFKAYGIRVNVIIKMNISGDGKFEIDFLDKPSQKSVDRSFWDVVKWILRK